MSTPSVPENTSTRDPLLHLLGMGEDSSRYVEEMERSGQQQVVNSDVLPTDSPWEQLQALGFAKGEQVPGDALFTQCSLPEGWTRASSDHAMSSHVLDQRGVKRLEIFYKAAFYDRKAHAYLVAPGFAVATTMIYGPGEVELPPVWDQLDAAERAEVTTVLNDYLVRAEKHPNIYADRLPRVQALRELVNR